MKFQESSDIIPPETFVDVNKLGECWDEFKKVICSNGDLTSNDFAGKCWQFAVKCGALYRKPVFYDLTVTAEEVNHLKSFLEKSMKYSPLGSSQAEKCVSCMRFDGHDEDCFAAKMLKLVDENSRVSRR